MFFINISFMRSCTLIPHPLNVPFTNSSVRKGLTSKKFGIHVKILKFDQIFIHTYVNFFYTIVSIFVHMLIKR